MAFKAAEAVEVLEYDLNPYIDNKGTIPEPTSDQVNDFFESLRGMAVEFQAKFGNTDTNLEDLDNEQTLETLSKMDDKVLDGMQARYSAAVEGVTSGTITAEQFLKLPYRVQAAFMQWLGEQFRPEAATPATKR